MKVVNGREIPDIVGELTNQEGMNMLTDLLTEAANTLSATVGAENLAIAPTTGTALAITGTPTLGISLAGAVRGINFDGIVAPAAAGNYGQTLDCTWLAIDPGSGGSFGAKLMFSNTDTSGYTLYGFGLRCRSYAAQANAVCFNASASAGVANSGQLMGGEFYLQNSGSYTINDSDGLPSTALHVKSWLAAACSQTASALWIDDQSTTKATAQYMVDITMNGSVEIDKVFHIYGGEPGADTFIDFDTCDQGAGAFVTATASGGATRSHKIKCTVNGTTVGYLSLYTD